MHYQVIIRYEKKPTAYGLRRYKSVVGGIYSGQCIYGDYIVKDPEGGVIATLDPHCFRTLLHSRQLSVEILEKIVDGDFAEITSKDRKGRLFLEQEPKPPQPLPPP